MAYRTTRDIVIPAGTKLYPPPTASTRWKRDYDVPVALGNDHCGYLSMDPSEGLDSGWLEEVR